MADRKGFTKMSKREVQTVIDDLESDRRDYTRYIDNTDAQKAPKHLAKLERTLTAIDEQLRIARFAHQKKQGR